MDDTLRSHRVEPRQLDLADPCSIVVAYEDTATRDRVISICDHLVQALWQDVEFEMSWWKFDYLGDPQIAAAAATAAAKANLVIFSAQQAQALPKTVEAWIETWLVRRENPESALVALIGMGDDLTHSISPIHGYLRDVARRAKMDYLSRVPDSPSAELDVSFEAIKQRAEKMTFVMDTILHRIIPPSHWGINE